MFWQATLTKLSRHTRGLNRRQRATLLSETDLHELRQQAAQPQPDNLPQAAEVHYRLLGEQLSPYAGSGFEFAETRPFQHGDNIRFINWRRYANTGELYVNTFHEERRPQCVLLIDRRTGMQFGTQRQLKIQQAARCALYYLYKAQHQSIETGAAILDQQLHWYDPHRDMQSLLPLIQHINAGVRPSAQAPGTSCSLSQAIRTLQVRLLPGSIVIFCSDFADLQFTDRAVLANLAQRHSVLALQISDPAEQRLPAQTDYLFYDPVRAQRFAVNAHNRAVFTSAQQILSHRQQQIQTILSQSGIACQPISTTDEFPAIEPARTEST